MRNFKRKLKKETDAFLIISLALALLLAFALIVGIYNIIKL